jgi:hypothetical protein
MPAACCPIASTFAKGFVIVAAVGLSSFTAVGDDATTKQDAKANAPAEIATPAKPAAPTVTADPKKQPGPRAEYSPEQVVQIVMDALQNNDAADSGIVTTFNFASPGNKEVTGPVARFIPMVKTPAYKPMLNFRSAEYGKLELADDKTTGEQTVTLIAANGDVATYLFRLSKQPDGEFKGCWMTDGVIRVEQKGEQA